MELKEIYERLNTLGIPVTYHHFKKNSEITVPFCAYYLENRERYGADYENMLERRTVTIELYTEIKMLELEDKLFGLFDEFDLEIVENYIEDERLYMITVSFETLIKLNK